MGDFKNHMFWNIFCITVSLTLIGLNVYGLIPGKFLIHVWLLIIVASKNPLIIGGATIGFIIYFGIIIAVLICPVRDLDDLPSELEDNKILTERNSENSSEEGTID